MGGFLLLFFVFSGRMEEFGTKSLSSALKASCTYYIILGTTTFDKCIPCFWHYVILLFICIEYAICSLCDVFFFM